MCLSLNTSSSQIRCVIVSATSRSLDSLHSFHFSVFRQLPRQGAEEVLYLIWLIPRPCGHLSLLHARFQGFAARAERSAQLLDELVVLGNGLPSSVKHTSPHVPTRQARQYNHLSIACLRLQHQSKTGSRKTLGFTSGGMPSNVSISVRCCFSSGGTIVLSSCGTAERHRNQLVKHRATGPSARTQSHFFTVLSKAVTGGGCWPSGTCICAGCALTGTAS